MLKKALLGIMIAGVAFALLAQLVPYGRDHTNPPVVAEPPWDSPATRALARRACFDCHSNETAYPWYSNVAPASWLLANHVAEGRAEMNLSVYVAGDFTEAEDIAEVIREGEMPPFSYLPLHPEARLTEAEKTALIEGFRRTLRQGD